MLAEEYDKRALDGGRHSAPTFGAAGPYEADPVWLAIWGAHLKGRYGQSVAPHELGGLLASAIDLGDRGGEETLNTLIEIGDGAHPTGLMGRHVIVALLGSSRPEAWEFVERLLLAAQRQEGLRQSILESVDESHPAAFDRMVALILDQRLLRFAAAVRAAGVWLGCGADVGEVALIERRLRVLVACRASGVDRAAALRSADPWDVYLALLAGGMHDVFTTFPEARALLTAAEPGLRAAAVRYAAATAVEGRDGPGRTERAARGRPSRAGGRRDRRVRRLRCGARRPARADDDAAAMAADQQRDGPVAARRDLRRRAVGGDPADRTGPARKRLTTQQVHRECGT